MSPGESSWSAGAVAGQSAQQIYQGGNLGAGTSVNPAWFGSMAEAMKRVEDLCDRIDSVATSLVGGPPPMPANADPKSPTRVSGGVFGDLEEIATRTRDRVSWAMVRLGHISQQLPK